MRLSLEQRCGPGRRPLESFKDSRSPAAGTEALAVRQQRDCSRAQQNRCIDPRNVASTRIESSVTLSLKRAAAHAKRTRRTVMEGAVARSQQTKLGVSSPTNQRDERTAT